MFGRRVSYRAGEYCADSCAKDAGKCREGFLFGLGHVVESPWHGGCATAWFEAEIFCPFLLGRLALLVHEPLILLLAGN